ncbi:DMT family transporter [Alkalicoccus urumqiensis]|uniref:EamA/RhaT family transporter n=1 Tax=Alkalicoccus urumqiensis TaxID=1548213 RepID=A0A2P6MEY0_ALKUR|nr:DMT family transporter [Alkalicoccus urumqiensis]PRO64801.1 EamA/RhaT family transporter [Alkalicoccus urumqiensis]
MIRGSIFMVLVVLFYAGNIITGKALNDLPPFTIAWIRLSLAALLLIPLGAGRAWRERRLFLTYKWPFFWMTLSGVTFFNTFIYGSLQYTSAANVSVLETVIPAVTITAAALILKETLKPRQWAGVVVSLAGALYVITEGSVERLLAMDWNPGDLIMIGAIVCWSVYSLLVRRYMYLFPAFAALFIMNVLSVIVLFPFAAGEWLIGGVPDADWGASWGGLLYLGIFPSVVALLLFNRAVGILGAGRASVFLNLLPPATIAGAWLLLGETIVLPQIIGAFIVISGVIMTTWKKKETAN